LANTSEPIVSVDARRGLKLRLSGEADLGAARHLHQAAGELLDRTGPVVVDCRRLERLSGAALQVLAAMAAEMDRRGRALTFRSLSPRLRPTLALAGLDGRRPPEKTRKR
jgi:anti-anti-sigma factor